MEDEMIERVARALFEKHHTDKLALIRAGKVSASMSGIEYFDGGWDGQDESAKEYLRGEARAAIAAMRGPVMAILTARAALYRAKAERHMARGCDLDDDPTRAELATHAEEAMTWAEREMTELFDAALAPAKQPA